MKKLLSLLLTIALLLSLPSPAYATITERKSKEAERLLWDELSLHSPSDVVTAGVLAYFWRESQYKSDAVTGWDTLQAYEGFDLCGYVVSKTDKGMEDGSSRQWFVEAVRSCGGFGLGQWYATDYLEDLYDFARVYGGSIADAETQCAFVFHSLEQNEKLWKRLKRCKDPARAGRLIAIYYDGSEDGAPYMGRKAKQFYDRYHE